MPRDIEGIDLLDADRFVSGEHHAMLKRLRDEAPVYFHDEPDGPGFYNVVKHADLVAMNRDVVTFSSQVGGTLLKDPTSDFDTRGILMLDSDAPMHTRYRRLVNKGFTPRMIGLLEQHLTHRAELIVDRVIEAGTCEFVTDLAAELPLQAIAEIMGVPQEERHLLFEWSNRMVGNEDPEYNDSAGDNTCCQGEHPEPPPPARQTQGAAPTSSNRVLRVSGHRRSSRKQHVASDAGRAGQIQNRQKPRPDRPSAREAGIGQSQPIRAVGLVEPGDEDDRGDEQRRRHDHGDDRCDQVEPLGCRHRGRVGPPTRQDQRLPEADDGLEALASPGDPERPDDDA